MDADLDVDIAVQVMAQHDPGVKVAYRDGKAWHIAYCGCGVPEDGLAIPGLRFPEWRPAHDAARRHVAERIVAAIRSGVPDDTGWDMPNRGHATSEPVPAEVEGTR